MKRIELNGIGLWQFSNLSGCSGVRHFVSDRVMADHSDGEQFTLSFSSSPDREKIRRNRETLAHALGIESGALVFPSQVHKTKIVHVHNGMDKSALMETDALITNERALCVAVMSADCVPILLFDPVNHAVGAVHSGWRGTVAKILALTLQQMQQRYGSEGKHIIAGIGPSVCQDSYEVGEEVVDAVTMTFPDSDQLLIPTRSKHAKLDLWKANQFQLLEFGVLPANIEISDLCTVKNNNFFFSARRGDNGRFAAGIMLE